MKILFMSLSECSSIDEKGIYTDLLREFQHRGHDIYIISPVERRKKIETFLDCKDNVNLLTVKIGNIFSKSIVEKGIATITISFFLKRAIKKYWSKEKFALILYPTPPITIYSVVKNMKKKYKAITYLMLKDIFPQNAVDLNMISKHGLIYYFFRMREKQLYHISDIIGCMSEANVEYLKEHNPDIVDKVEICPNCIEASVNLPSVDRTQILSNYGIPINKKLLMYGGNLGKPQGIDFMIQCIENSESIQNVHYVICGNGTEYEKIHNAIQERKLSNVTLISGLPKEEYEILLSCCDIGMIYLDARFTIPNFPSRVLSYMDFHIPILACTDRNTDIGQTIESHNIGKWCESIDVNEYVKVLKEMLNSNLQEMGENSYIFLMKHYQAKNACEIISKSVAMKVDDMRSGQ